jgi:hypothetical protein
VTINIKAPRLRELALIDRRGHSRALSFEDGRAPWSNLRFSLSREFMKRSCQSSVVGLCILASASCIIACGGSGSAGNVGGDSGDSGGSANSVGRSMNDAGGSSHNSGGSTNSDAGDSDDGGSSANAGSNALGGGDTSSAGTAGGPVNGDGGSESAGGSSGSVASAGPLCDPSLPRAIVLLSSLDAQTACELNTLATYCQPEGLILPTASAWASFSCDLQKTLQQDCPELTALTSASATNPTVVAACGDSNVEAFTSCIKQAVMDANEAASKNHDGC